MVDVHKIIMHLLFCTNTMAVDGRIQNELFAWSQHARRQKIRPEGPRDNSVCWWARVGAPKPIFCRGGAPHLDLRMIKTNNYLSLRGVFWPLSSGL